MGRRNRSLRFQKATQSGSSAERQGCYLTEYGGKKCIVPPAIDEELREPIPIDDEWLKFVNLQDRLLEAVVILSKQRRRRTISAHLEALRDGFCRYLLETNRANISIDHITTGLMLSFSKWLNGPRDPDGSSWGKETQRKRWFAIKNVLEISEDKSPKLNLGAAEANANWRGGHLENQPIEGVSAEVLATLYVHCLGECFSTMKRFEEAERLIAENIEETSAYIEARDLRRKHRGDRAFYRDNPGRVLAAMRIYFPDNVFPANQTELRKIIGEEAFKVIKPFEKGVIEALVPTARSMFPFLVIFLVVYGVNLTPLLQVNRRNLEISQAPTSEFLQWDIRKKRGMDYLRTWEVTDEVDNPKVIYDFLVRYTETIRESLSPVDRDRLFVFFSNYRRNDYGVNRFRSFDAKGKGEGSDAFSRRLKELCEELDLDPASASSLRQGAIDHADELFEGDIHARQVAAGHKHIEVTHAHYTDSITRRRNHERLSLAQSQQSRRVESLGKVERLFAQGEQDIGSATPGFSCSDPFSSPIPGQTSGKLCTAYGRCPVCPLTAVNRDSPFSLACVVALRETVNGALGKTVGERFNKVWLPVLNALDEKWIPSFSKAAAADAENQIVPKLPDVD